MVDLASDVTLEHPDDLLFGFAVFMYWLEELLSGG
jgi:hypothetical protein